ncbi:MAG TPA: adenine phosphoribosyltransferase [Atribacteraceae bacterium]|nr:adenine phosphoribosyltransferase [Atribacteraceae bacterium]
MDLAQYIRNIPDFPKPGIQFKDITTLLKDPAAFHVCIDQLANYFRDSAPDLIVGIEARGFIIGAPIAYNLGCGFIPIRKKGKLPFTVYSRSFELEYGLETLEIHSDALEDGQKILIVDDVLATGGTTTAVCEMIEKLGGVIVGIGFVLELDFLKGRDKFASYNVHSLISV